MTTPNTSSTGGYLQPAQPSPPVLTNNLTFDQFIQTVFVGISGLPCDLVRPSWQVDPPKQPDIFVDWMAFAVAEIDPDTNAYYGVDSNGDNVFQRMELIEIQSHFYGKNAHSVCSLTRDGFQIPQNLDTLRAVNMGFVNTSKMLHVPDLVNERWMNRYTMSFYLRREILRTYPVLNFVSAKGNIQSVVGSNVKTIAFDANNEES